MTGAEARVPAPPARPPRMILEDRYAGLLEQVAEDERPEGGREHVTVGPSRLKRDLDRVLRDLLQGLIRQELTNGQRAFIEELETLLRQTIVDRVATWEVSA